MGFFLFSFSIFVSFGGFCGFFGGIFGGFFLVNNNNNNNFVVVVLLTRKKNTHVSTRLPLHVRFRDLFVISPYS